MLLRQLVIVLQLIRVEVMSLSSSTHILFLRWHNSLKFHQIFPQPFQQNADTNNIEKVREEPGSEITPECLVKHPLQNQWTLWYLENDRSKSWEDMQNEITSFDTVEDFWSLYNHIRVASELKQGNDYSLFKKSIRPMWEDAANKRGGRWVLNLNKNQRRNELDALWMDVVSVEIWNENISWNVCNQSNIYCSCCA